jgi:hypothetical protein
VPVAPVPLGVALCSRVASAFVAGGVATFWAAVNPVAELVPPSQEAKAISSQAFAVATVTELTVRLAEPVLWPVPVLSATSIGVALSTPV